MWPSEPVRGWSIINAEPTPYDDLADAVISDPISEVLPVVVASRA